MDNNKFEFDGDWMFKYELNELSKTLSFNGINRELKIREKLNIRFLDKRDYSPDPSNEQLSAFYFIIRNQKEIINALYNYIVNIVFPLHKIYIDDEEMFFPRITSPNELSKVLGLDEIVIHIESKDGFAYTSFIFEDFSADTEHGQTITLHKLDYLACGEDWDYRPIYLDLGLDYEKKSQNDTNEYIEFYSKPLQYQKPILKYNKLKPWQKDINRLYPIRLIQGKKNDEFLHYIENLYTPNDEYSSLENFSYWAKQADNFEAEQILKIKMGDY